MLKTERDCLIVCFSAFLFDWFSSESQIAANRDRDSHTKSISCHDMSYIA